MLPNLQPRSADCAPQTSSLEDSPQRFRRNTPITGSPSGSPVTPQMASRETSRTLNELGSEAFAMGMPSESNTIHRLWADPAVARRQILLAPARPDE